MSHVVRVREDTFRRLLALSRVLKLSVQDTIEYLLDRVASEEPA